MIIKVPVSANGRDVWTPVDHDIAVALGGRRLSLGSHGYAQMFDGGKVTLLHRFIMECTPGDGRIVDHIDRDRLNNLRSNLRFVTASESTQNRRIDNPFRGAHKHKRGSRWYATVQHERRVLRLGNFNTREEAAAAAAAYRAEHFIA